MTIENSKQLAQVKDTDWFQGVQIKLHKSLIGANRHRNIESYPILKPKVNDLKASIKSSQTTKEIESGMWWNQEGAIFGIPDVTKIEFDENGICIAFPYTSTDVSRPPVERPSGHHRAEAADALGFAFHAVTVRVIDSDTRYRMMANENYDTYNAHPIALMETIKQGHDLLFAYAREGENWDEVNKLHPDVFASEKAWKNAISQGIGKQAIVNFLGKPWNTTTVSYLLRMIKHVENNVFTIKDIGRLSSISIANALGSMLNSLNDGKAWPVYFKNKMAKDSLKAVSDPNTVATVKIINDAKGFMMNQNFNPVLYLRNKQMVIFDVVNEIVKLIKAELKKDETFNPEKLIAMGFDGFEEEINKAVTQMQGSDTATTVTTEESDSAAAEAADAAIEASESDMPEVPDADTLAEFTDEVVDDGEVGETSVIATMKSIIEAAYDMEMLLGRLKDADVDYKAEANASFAKAVMSSLTALHKFATDNLG